jgi:uncharacterized membrane protein
MDGPCSSAIPPGPAYAVNRIFHVRLLAAFLVWLSGGFALYAQTAPIFERDVLPLLQSKCGVCHGPKARTAGLDIHEISLILRGSASGPVIVKGSASSSLLWKRIKEGTMPPGNEKLLPEEVQLIGRWIDAGALSTAKAPELPERLFINPK